LLIAEARKIPARASPVIRERSHGLVAKKRAQTAHSAAGKVAQAEGHTARDEESQSAGDGNSFSKDLSFAIISFGAARSSASQAKTPAQRIPRIPSSNTGARQPAISPRQPE
jgi:hypothetical protein